MANIVIGDKTIHVDHGALQEQIETLSAAMRYVSNREYEMLVGLLNLLDAIELAMRDTK